MKQKTFYSNLIQIENLEMKLGKLKLSENERKHLLNVLHSSVHTVVMDTILSELDKEDKKIFLSHVYVDKHEIIWSFLYHKIDNPKEKISKNIEKTIAEFEKDMEKLLK